MCFLNDNLVIKIGYNYSSKVFELGAKRDEPICRGMWDCISISPYLCWYVHNFRFGLTISAANTHLRHIYRNIQTIPRNVKIQFFRKTSNFLLLIRA